MQLIFCIYEMKSRFNSLCNREEDLIQFVWFFEGFEYLNEFSKRVKWKMIWIWCLTSLNAFASKGSVTIFDGTLCLLRKFTKPLKFLFKCIAIIIELSLLCLNDVVHVSVLCFWWDSYSIFLVWSFRVGFHILILSGGYVTAS